MIKNKINIPKEIILVADKLMASGYNAYLVGGCVRDILMGRTERLGYYDKRQTAGNSKNFSGQRL